MLSISAKNLSMLTKSNLFLTERNGSILVCN